MPLNEDLLTMNISHQIGLRRLENQQTEEILSFYKDQRRALNNRIKNLYPTSEYTKTKLSELKKIVNQRIARISRRTKNQVTKSLNEISAYELEYQTRLYSGAVSKNLSAGLTFKVNANIVSPSHHLVRQAIQNDSFQGQVLDVWFSQFSNKVRNDLNRQLGISIFQGESLGQASRRIRNVTDLSNRHATTITRTAMRHALNKSREFFAEENKIGKKRYTAILDGRTTFICASLDGRTYDAKDMSAPEIPQHMGCRSDYTFFFDELDLASRRITIADTRSAKRIDRDLRTLARRNGTSITAERRKWAKRVVGRISGKTTYKEFFAKQSAGFQRNYLGDTRYRLYKQGGLDLDRFVDSLSGQKIDLATLRLRDAQAFKLAGF